ncbi:MAG: hemolysin III family protein [Acidimicrobiia bacterium]
MNGSSHTEHHRDPVDALHHAADAARELAAEVKPRLRGVSHFYGLWVSIAAGVVLVLMAPAGLARFGAIVYSLTLAGMFGASSLYHLGNWSPPTARRLLKLDHTAIFLLIAGTYTPICLLAMGGVPRAVLLGLVWLIAIAGIVFEWLPVPAPRGYVTTVYISLGWIGVAAMVPLYRHTGWEGLLLIAGGGVSYTVGAVVLARRRPDPWPRVFGYWEIFHAFVIVAAVMHWCAIAFLVLPLAE